MPLIWHEAIRHKRNVKIAHNTYIEDGPNATFYIRFHTTRIITLFEGGMSVNVGGWRTPTTSNRVGLFLQRHSWAMSTWKFWHVHDPYIQYAYAPDIELHDDGTCKNYTGWPKAVGSLGHKIKLDKWWINNHDFGYDKPDIRITHRHHPFNVPVIDDKCSGCNEPVPEMVNGVMLFKNSGLGK